MNVSFYEMVESNPVIAAVKDMEGLEKCCRLKDIKVVFILFGDICSIPEIAVDYVKNNTRADGIITTKPALIKRAKELSLATVMSIS